jgi:hypothetical protein
VTYNGNGNTGGTAPVDSINYKDGDTVTVLGNTGNMIKTNYTFLGWSVNPDAVVILPPKAVPISMLVKKVIK